MAYARRAGLGIAPVIVAAAIPVVENFFSSVFGGNHDAIEPSVPGQVQANLDAINANLAQINTPGTAAYTNWIMLRCHAGDQSVLTAYHQVSGDVTATACGYSHRDSKKFAASAVMTVANAAASAGIAVPAAFTFNLGDGGIQTIQTGTLATIASSPAPSSSSTPGGTLPVNVGGGVTVGLPVPTSSLLNAQLFGVPVLLLGLLGVGAAFALGGSHGRRA